MVYDTYLYCGPGLEGRARQFLMESSSGYFNRKYSVDSAIAVSWTSEDSLESHGAETIRLDPGSRFTEENAKTGLEKSRQKATSVSVDFDEVHRADRRASAPEYVCDKGGQRKLQSILRAEPQVFKVYDKSQQKKKKKSKKVTDPGTSPQRRVGFNLPQGVKIPERVAIKAPSRVPVPIYRAKKTLGALKQKITGETETIPWKPSPHVIPMQHQTKFKRNRKISPPSSTIPILKRLTELKLKNLEELDEFAKMEEFQSYMKANTDDEGSYLSKSFDDLQSDDNDDENEDSEYNSDGFESANETTQDDDDGTEAENDNDNTNGEADESDVEEQNKISQSKNRDEDHEEAEEHDDFPKLSRRKAFGYHLKTINLANINTTTPAPAITIPKKSSRKGPRFPTGGHGLGHADPHHHLYKNHKCNRQCTVNNVGHKGQDQNHNQNQHCKGNVCPVHPNGLAPCEADSADSAKLIVTVTSSPIPSPNFKRNFLNNFKKFKITSSAATSDNESSDDVRSGKSSRENSVQMNENEILLNLVTGGQGDGTSNGSSGRTILIDGKPVKIVNARYRRVPSFDLYPYVSTDPSV